MIYVCVIDVPVISEPRLTHNLSFVNGKIKIDCGVELTSDSDMPPNYIVVTGQTDGFVLRAIYATGKEYEEDCNTSSSIMLHIRRHNNNKNDLTEKDVQYEHIMTKYLQNVTNWRCIYESQTVGQRTIELVISHPNLLLLRMYYSCRSVWIPNNYDRFERFHKTTNNLFTGLLWPRLSYGNQYDIGAPTLSLDLNNNDTSLILTCPIPFKYTNIFQWGVSKLPHTPIVPIRLIQMSKNSDETYFPSLRNMNRPNSPDIKVQEGELFKRNNLQIGYFNNTNLVSINSTMCYVSTEYAKSLYPIQGKQNCFKLLSFAYSHPNRTDTNPHSFYNLTYLLHNKILDFDGQSIGEDDSKEFIISLNKYKVKNFLFQLPSLFYMRSILLNPRSLLTDTEGGLNVTDNPLYIHPTIDIYKDFMAFLIRWTRQYEIMKIKWAQRSLININDVYIDYSLTYKCEGRILLIVSNDSRCLFTQPHWLREKPLFQTDSNYSVVGIYSPYKEVSVLVQFPYDSLFSNDTISFCSWQKYLCFEGEVEYSNATIQLIEPNPWEMEDKFYSNIYKGFENEWVVTKDFRESYAIHKRESTPFLNNLFHMYKFLKELPFISNLITISNYLDKNNICPCRPMLTDLKTTLAHNSTPTLPLLPHQFNPTDKFYCNIFYDTNSITPLNVWKALEEFMCVQNKNTSLTALRTRILNYQPKLYIEMFPVNLTHVSYVCRSVFSQCFDLEEAVVDPLLYFNFDNTTQITVSKDLNITIEGLNQTLDATFSVLPLPLNHSIEPYEFNHMLVVPKRFIEDYVEINCQHMMQTSRNIKIIPANFTQENPVSLASCTFSYDIKANIHNQCIICAINGSSDCDDKLWPKYSLVSDDHYNNLSCSKDPNIYFVDNTLVNQTKIDFTYKMQTSGNNLHFYCHKDSQSNISFAVLCADKDEYHIIDSLPNNSLCGPQFSNDQHVFLSNNLQAYKPQCLPLPLYIPPVTSIHKFNETHLSIQCMLPKWMALPVCAKKSINLQLYSRSTSTSGLNSQLIANKIGSLCTTYPYLEISCTINNDDHDRILFRILIPRESYFWHRIFNVKLTKLQVQCNAYKDQLLKWKTVHLSSKETFNNITSTTRTKTENTMTDFTHISKMSFHPSNFNFHIGNEYIYLVLTSIYLLIICIPVIIVMYIIKTQQNIKIRNAFQ